MAESTPLVDNGIAPIRVSKDVYSLEPSNVESQENANGAPQLILLFGWMDASLRPLKKYMGAYRNMYPHASQIIILCRQSTSWTSNSKNLDEMRPAAELLERKGFFGPQPPNTIFHVFSNGGGYQLVYLSELLQKYPRPVESTPPAISIVLDSLPGSPGLRPTLEAYTALIRSTLFKLLACIPLIILYAVIATYSFLRRQPAAHQILRTRLNDSNLLPWTNKHTPRVYIYSKEDKIIEYTKIEEHMAYIREKGLSVRGERFVGSSHVAHARKDPIRYWDIVAENWAEALKAQKSYNQ